MTFLIHLFPIINWHWRTVMSNTLRINKAVHAVQTADLSVLDRTELVDVITDIGAIRAWLDATDVGVARRGRELADAGQSEPAASLLTNNGHVSGKAARAAAERATVCEEMPNFETALAAGDVSAGHIDALANAGRRLNDEQRLEFNDMKDALLAKAEGSSVEHFERECRDLKTLIQTSTGSDVDELDKQRSQREVKRWVEKGSGMHCTLLKLDPLSDNKMWPVVDRKLASLRQQDGTSGVPFRELQAEAFLNTITDSADHSNGSSGSASESAIPEISVLIDYQTLVDQFHTAGLCETSDGTAIPVSTVRRLCCDAVIAPLITNLDGQVLDAGRTTRTANRKQRRALRAMHRTCAHPQCSVVFDSCRIHHVVWWNRDLGPTDIANLLPLCEQHHHLVHEGGWVLTMKPDRVATWKRPDGTTFHIGTTIDRIPKPAAQTKSESVTAKPPAKSKRKLVEQPKLC
jgi:hypothetical protein